MDIPQYPIGEFGVLLNQVQVHNDHAVAGVAVKVQTRFPTLLRDFVNQVPIAQFGKDRERLAWKVRPVPDGLKSQSVSTQFQRDVDKALRMEVFDGRIKGGSIAVEIHGANVPKPIWRPVTIGWQIHVTAGFHSCGYCLPMSSSEPHSRPRHHTCQRPFKEYSSFHMAGTSVTAQRSSCPARAAHGRAWHQYACLGRSPLCRLR